MDVLDRCFRLRMVRYSASYGVTRRFLLVFIVLSQLCVNLILASTDGFKDHVNEEARNQQQGVLRIERLHKFYSRCSRKQVQIVGRHVNANGRLDHPMYTELRLESVNLGGYVRISSAYNQNYLCFNKRGRLTVREYWTRRRRSQCVFKDILTDDSYTELQSAYNTSWYVGFRHNGKPLKTGRRRLKPHCFQFTKQDVNRGKYLNSKPPQHGPDVSFPKLFERTLRTMKREKT